MGKEVGEAPLLKIKDLEVCYGSIVALRGINLEVGLDEQVAVLGANGAGKSTLLKTISGLLRPTHGFIEFEGDLITKYKPHQIVEKGIIHIVEGRGIFNRMKVYENLIMGAYNRKDKIGIRRDLERIFELFPRLKERMNQIGGTLSGGEQQMLAIGRGLMCQARFLMLDEPTLGLSPLMVEEIFSILAELASNKMPILLVEQNAYQALRITNRVYVLELGHIKITDFSASLLNNEAIVSAYLGSESS